jgi:PAS domain-containing protein
MKKGPYPSYQMYNKFVLIFIIYATPTLTPQKTMLHTVTVNMHTDNVSVENNKPKVQCTTLDLALVIVTIIILCLGVGLGLMSFFLLQARNTVNMVADINSKALFEVGHLQSSVNSATRYSDSFSAFMYGYSFYYYSPDSATANDGWPDLYLQTIPYSEMSGGNVAGSTGIAYCRFTTDDERDQFLAKVRTWEPNFNVVLLANGSFVPAPVVNGTLRAVVIQTTPNNAQNRIILGYDNYARPDRQVALAKVIQTRSTAVTGKVTFAGPLSDPGYLVFSPVITPKNNTMVGATYTGFYFSNMVAASFASSNTNSYSTLNNFVITLYDGQASKTDLQNYLLYSSVTNDQAKAMIGQSATTVADYQKIVDSSYDSIPLTIKVGYDRNWTVVFSATPQYVKSMENNDKWIPLIILILSSIFIVSVVIMFSKRLQYTRTLRDLHKERIQVLEENRVKLQNLLNKIAFQERTTRLINDTVPDFIIVIDDQGKILRTNVSFDSTFNYKLTEYDQGVHISSILKNVPEDTFTKKHEAVITLETTATTRFNHSLPVQLFIRYLREEVPSNIPQDNQMSQLTYVIIARNMSNDHRASVYGGDQRPLYGVTKEFFQLWASDKDSFRKRFTQFAESVHNDENLIFLNRVAVYRQTTDLDERVEDQMKIFKYFFGNNAVKQLNVTEDLINNLKLRMNRDLGDVDVFGKVEEFVLDMVAADIYPRYKENFKQ